MYRVSFEVTFSFALYLNIEGLGKELGKNGNSFQTYACYNFSFSADVAHKLKIYQQDKALAAYLLPFQCIQIFRGDYCPYCVG